MTKRPRAQCPRSTGRTYRAARLRSTKRLRARSAVALRAATSGPAAAAAAQAVAARAAEAAVAVGAGFRPRITGTLRGNPASRAGKYLERAAARCGARLRLRICGRRAPLGRGPKSYGFSHVQRPSPRL